MKSATGRWVSGDDFFDRNRELEILESRVQDGNHILLAGQRRMGKTSIARELARRLEAQNWTTLFADVEDATCSEDVIADIAEAAYPVRSISSRITSSMSRWFEENVQEIGASEFRIKFRAGVSGSWRRWGNELIEHCANHQQPVLLVVDELPIFLLRLLREDNGEQEVDEFLSWLRGAFQTCASRSLVLVVSGSIGLAPLVQRLGMPDRINYLHPFRLGPWSRQTSVECIQRLAENHRLQLADGVANKVYESIGIGVPFHVQSFFAHLHEFAVMRNLDCIAAQDVDFVYRHAMLGPSGQSDLAHYEARLRNALDGSSHRIAMEILAEAATQEVFTHNAKNCLENWYSPIVVDVSQHVTEVLNVLLHDGYLELDDGGHRFPFRLLKDWWSIRFRHNHVALESRNLDKD